MTRPLFLVGNKRSGTSHLVRLLNLHPQVFVSHESDIVWALTIHPRSGVSVPFVGFGPWPSSHRGELRRPVPPGAKPTREFPGRPAAAHGSGYPFPGAPDKNRTCVDRRQEAVPARRSATRDLHARALSRCALPAHRASSVFGGAQLGSLQREARRIWLGLTREEKVERWTFHEQQALSLRDRLPTACTVCAMRTSANVPQGSCRGCSASSNCRPPRPCWKKRRDRPSGESLRRGDRMFSGDDTHRRGLRLRPRITHPRLTTDSLQGVVCGRARPNSAGPRFSTYSENVLDIAETPSLMVLSVRTLSAAAERA